METINTLTGLNLTYTTLFIMAIIVILAIFSVKERNRKEKQAWKAIRREEVSRISEGVANGIIKIFNDKNFIQALNDGVSIKVVINVDGSQNIIINGNGNQIERM